MICIPCERKKKLQLAKLPTLRELAKKRAKENNEYFVIYYDKEDFKYMVTSESKAKAEQIIEFVSPY